MPAKNWRRQKSPQQYLADNSAFSWSELERLAIAETLPIETKGQVDAAIGELQKWARQYLADIAHRKDNWLAAETTRRQLSAYVKLARLMSDDPHWDSASHAEAQARLAHVANAYDRLKAVFHGADVDRDTFYFRILSVWEELGGSLGSRWYTPKPLKRFVLAVTKPLLNDRAPKPDSIDGIVRRYKTACRRGHIGTVPQFKAGKPLIAGVDQFVLLGNPTQKARKK